MPNYVQNQITSTSPHIEQLWEAIKGKDCLLDFNRIIPMPPSLQIESSSMMELSFAAEVYRRDGIIFSALQTDYKKGRQDHESMKAYLHRLEQQKRIAKLNFLAKREHILLQELATQKEIFNTAVINKIQAQLRKGKNNGKI